ncbi:MAG: hypothetical protein R3208_14050 [Ketobacteraceae bacterium]|nr:hypothetical protein [Ketobacteraceae bacterium]
MARYYNDLYTWHAPLVMADEESPVLMEHSDGSVSLAMLWDGLSTELKPLEKVKALYSHYYDTLKSLPTEHGLVMENHWLRQFDDTIAQHYLDYGERHITRCEPLAKLVRQSMAEHVGSRGMSNLVFTVLTLPGSQSPLAGMFPRREKAKLRKRGRLLLEIAKELQSYLPGAEVCTSDAYELLIWECYHRDRARDNALPEPNPRFKLRDRIALKPGYSGNYLKLGETYTRVALLIDYPDALPNWFYELANQFGVEMHITQILKPLDAGNEVRKSASQSEKAIESASVLGGEEERGKLTDHNNFRSYVADNNLSIIGNCYILKFHHTDLEHLDTAYRAIRRMLSTDGAVLSDSEEEVQRLYWRVSQPGQGYKSAFLRPDHTWQVAHMAPIMTFADGDLENPQMLRITVDGKLVTLSYPPDGTNHALTGAKTGSGKGVAQIAQILELFPLGTNFYIAEVGPTYKWTVEGLGGTYFHLDPNKTVISPFPNWDMADRDNTKTPLDADIVAPTIGALMPILAGPKEHNIRNHLESVAEQVMQAMYAFADISEHNAPTLADFHHFAEEVKGEFSGTQGRACQAMIDNLNSFLSKTAGSRFEKADTLDFNSGIVGVDFKPLMGNEELAKFLLVFISLRYKQLAFANAHPCRIVLDELHEFSRIDPVLTTTLMKQLTRMGRKEAGAFHGISQEPLDLELDDGILNQITHRELLYLQSGHRKVAELFRLNDTVLDRWLSFRDPEAAGRTMNYRQCIKMVGEDAFDLHMTFPQLLLDLGDSAPRALAIKEEIGQQTQDPIERLKLFREAMDHATVAA